MAEELTQPETRSRLGLNGLVIVKNMAVQASSADEWSIVQPAVGGVIGA
jgi:hypothetical protein